MNRTVHLTISCFALVLFAKGQSETIQIPDLYGDWTLYHNEYDVEEEYVFQRQQTPKKQLENTNVTISLLALNECRINYDMPAIYCGYIGGINEYTWYYNADLQSITIYKSETILKYFKEAHPEEFKNLELPDRYLEMELSLLLLKDGSFGLEVTNWE